ncbi:MAG TPA: sulfatase-like hydrolase/transferase [Rhodanobacteraceae bacterium]|nr:sulfatase-like hydrolase/transferase [Rhodanobacteraceae bacterium]
MTDEMVQGAVTTAPPPRRAPRRPVWSWLRTAGFWIVIVLLLTVPLQLALHYTTGRTLNARALKACLGIIGLLWCCDRLASRFGRPWWIVLAIISLALYLLHVFFFGLARFSGRGFDDGFFLSLHAEAAAVAWRYYAQYIYFFVGGAVVLGAVLYAYAKRPARARLRTGVIVCVISVALLLSGYRTLPEYQLATATFQWLHPTTTHLSPALLQRWAHNPLLNLDPPDKSAVWASAPKPARNLVLLYVESGGFMLAPAAKYPGLVPGSQQLIRQHGFLPYLDTSSYMTIEGLVNTQCGTLIPFVQGDESAGTFGRLVPDLTCLGDVLHRAGYRQVYYAGTSRNFAGTGQFLALHGYDEIVGKEDWRRQGVKPDPDSYAIGDPRLFELSIAELRKLQHAGQPFNLTLFTVGTHIPGFSYPGCAPYGDGTHRYLNAVHCDDTLITQWIAKLRQDGLLKNTLLVITGDHQVFRSAQMLKLFGEQRVLSSHLPFIVIGADVPKAVARDGAGYDIAPTIIDLLGIRTNATFPLGRSLLKQGRALDYHVSRYADFLNGKIYLSHGEHVVCDKPAPGARDTHDKLPLDACGRADLQALLDYQAAKYARRPQRSGSTTVSRRPSASGVVRSRGLVDR